LCLPVLTYSGQATLKMGVHPEHHGIVYNHGDGPKLLQDERLLDIPPVAIVMDKKDPKERLSQATRINYGKLYTIEHNVKVHFVGTVYKPHLRLLLQSYDRLHPPLASQLLNIPIDKPPASRLGGAYPQDPYSSSGQYDPVAKSSFSHDTAFYSINGHSFGAGHRNPLEYQDVAPSFRSPSYHNAEINHNFSVNDLPQSSPNPLYTPYEDNLYDE